LIFAAGLLQIAGSAGASSRAPRTRPTRPPRKSAEPPSPAGSDAAVPLSRAVRPRAAFEATTVAAARAALGASTALPGPAIRLEAPVIATEVGPVTLSITPELAAISQVAVLVHRAAFPLAALLQPDGAGAPYEVTVHLARTDRVTVLVQAEGRWYSVSREIKVAAQPW
jgi:sulfur-oxidizing protein SoxY